jgi:hypothetical protein
MANTWKKTLLSQLSKKGQRIGRYSDDESKKEDVDALKRLRDAGYTS